MAEAAALRVAVVGCGAIAQSWLGALAATPGVRLCGIVESDGARRAELAAQLPVPVVAELPGLAAVAPQAAIVCTPPATHPALAAQLLAAGLHVLCEKPLATDLAQARALLATARAAGRVLMLSAKFRYGRDARAARPLVQSGQLGAIQEAEIVFTGRVDMSRRWNADPARSGGGVVMDNGPHAADLCRFLLGPIARVQARFLRPVQPIPVEDSARVMFMTDAEVPCLVTLSWSVHRDVPWFAALRGSAGALELGWKQSRWRASEAAPWQTLGAGYDKAAAFAAQLQDFAAACGGATPHIDADDALATVQVVAAAYRSARTGEWCEVTA